MPHLRTLTSAALVLLILGAPATASARQVVAISSFQGHDGHAVERLEREVREAFAVDYQVVSPGAAPVHGMITGRVEQQVGSHYSLYLQLLDPTSRAHVADIWLKLREPRLLQAQRYYMVTELAPAIHSLAVADVDVTVAAPDNGAMPMELLVGTNVIERTIVTAGDGQTAIADVFARGDLYVFSHKRNLLKNVGAMIAIGRPLGDDTVDDVRTELGITTRQRVQRSALVVLARADLGVSLGASGSDVSAAPIARGQLATGAAVGGFLLLAELANASFSGNSDRDGINLMPNLVVDWRLRQSGLHPYAIAVVPLHQDVREHAPLIVQLGLRYER